VHTTPQGSDYKIARFFYGGEFDFARLTYYPDPAGGRGYLYWEDGPMLQGDHTPYDEQWMYVNASAETELCSLLKQLGAKLDDAAPTSPKANAKDSSSDSTQPRSAAQSGQATGAQTSKSSEPDGLPTTVIALGVAVVGLLGAASAFLVWRGRRTAGAR